MCVCARETEIEAPLAMKSSNRSSSDSRNSNSSSAISASKAEYQALSMGEAADDQAIVTSPETVATVDQTCTESAIETADTNVTIQVDEGFSSVGHQHEGAAVDTSLESNNSTNKSQSSDKPDEYNVSSEGIEYDEASGGAAESGRNSETAQSGETGASTSAATTLTIPTDDRSFNMHRRFIRKSLDASNQLFYTKNSFIESDAIETEYPRNLDDNIELLSSETELRIAQLQFETSFDIPNHELKEVPIISEDDDEPVGVSPCGRFFKYGEYGSVLGLHCDCASFSRCSLFA